MPLCRATLPLALPKPLEGQRQSRQWQSDFLCKGQVRSKRQDPRQTIGMHYTSQRQAHQESSTR
jgi:hypothetical protein